AGDLGRVQADFRALLAELDTAWATSQAPGEAARTLASRVAASAGELPPALLDVPGAAAQRSRVSSAYLAFERAVEQTGTLAAELIEEQAAYAEQVAYVRDSGRATVERMRDIRLDDIAADTVQLVLGTLDFARPDGTVRDFELRRLL